MFLLLYLHWLSSRSQHTFNEFHSINFTCPRVVLKKIRYLRYLQFTESYSQLSFWKENSFCSKDFVVTVCNSFTISHPELFLEKVFLKICSKFTGEHPCRSAILIKLQSNTKYGKLVIQNVFKRINSLFHISA